jgi:hypothetical protein
VPETKSVFVPTGEVRTPRPGEFYFCTYPGCMKENTVEQCRYIPDCEQYEIYEEVKVRVDD